MDVRSGLKGDGGNHSSCALRGLSLPSSINFLQIRGWKNPCFVEKGQFYIQKAHEKLLVYNAQSIEQLVIPTLEFFIKVRAGKEPPLAMNLLLNHWMYDSAYSRRTNGIC